MPVQNLPTNPRNTNQEAFHLNLFGPIRYWQFRLLELAFNTDPQKVDINIQRPVDSHAKWLLDTGNYSDIKVKCGELVVNAHKAIICPQCDFFAGAVDHSFKESVDGIINLPEDDSATVKRMIVYLYTSDYNDEDGPDADDFARRSQRLRKEQFKSDSALLNNVSVFILADKYGIERLKLYSAAIIHKQLDPSKFEITLEVLTRLSSCLASSSNEAIFKAFVSKCIDPRPNYPAGSNFDAKTLENPFMQSADFKNLIVQSPETFSLFLDLCYADRNHHIKREHDFIKKYHDESETLDNIRTALEQNEGSLLLYCDNCSEVQDCIFDNSSRAFMCSECDNEVVLGDEED